MADNRRAVLEHLPWAITFESVARLGSFRAAAEELELARSTTSDHVAALEAALGLQLLHRTTRRLRLSAAGRELADATGAILAEWRSAEARVRAHAAHPQGSLTVTSSDLLMATLVVPAVVDFRATHPGVEVELRTSTDNLDLVREGIDLAVRSGPLVASGYGARELWRGPHVAVGHPDLARSFALDHPRDLEAAPWIELEGRRPLDTWTARDETCPHTRPAAIVADTPSVFLSVLLSGGGVGAFPELLVAPHIEAGRLKRLLPQWSLPPISFHLVTPSPRRVGAAVEALTEALRARVRGALAERDRGA